MLDAVHQRGVVFGNLHGGNILLDEHDAVGLIDFELACPVEQATRPALGVPGFRAPAGRVGFDLDRYALAAVRLWAFLPLNPLLELEPGKLPGYLDFVARRFDLPAGYPDRISRELAPRDDIPAARTELDQRTPDWSAVRKSIAEAILAGATPHRGDRLFPGDIEQFASGGVAFGHGAAGVLYALDAGGVGRYPEHEQWLSDAVRRHPPQHPGFSRGAHGIAYVLDRFGQHDLATELLTRCAPMVSGIGDHSLSGGLAGIGLTLLHLAEARQDNDFLTEAAAIGQRLAAALPRAKPPGSDGKAGLMHGWSGPGLLFIRLSDHTGDRRWLDLADRAVARDLLECVETPHRSLQVSDGRRTLPYLEIGSAGIAVVLTELACRAPGSPTVASLGDLLESCVGEFVVHSGLQLGRAGQVVALAHANRWLADPRLDQAIERHLVRLRWHAIPYGGGLAFPGNQLLRLSMDLDTGSAGVLLALAAVLDQHGPVLPFLTEQAPSAGAATAPAR
ncbi:hypothetical protein GCM10009754_17030 [Amycolatopsis minnesotensis]|uniref:Protein kinase domain-containing protein n=1 Tax=Amycolatopsis minnesotensis TaxID=337894 RepID=A0ABN2QBK1_9PSEU